MKLPYLTCCVGLAMRDVGALNAMTEAAQEVTLATFRRRCDTRAWEAHMGYERSRHGLALSRDWHVTYHRSQWKGRRCYYARHSAIEYIFCDPDTGGAIHLSHQIGAL